jgi:hypothetical protein
MICESSEPASLGDISVLVEVPPDDAVLTGGLLTTSGPFWGTTKSEIVRVAVRSRINLTPRIALIWELPLGRAAAVSNRTRCTELIGRDVCNRARTARRIHIRDGQAVHPDVVTQSGMANLAICLLHDHQTVAEFLFERLTNGRTNTNQMIVIATKELNTTRM